MSRFSQRLAERKSSRLSPTPESSRTPAISSLTAQKFAALLGHAHAALRQDGNSAVAFILRKLIPHLEKELRNVSEESMQIALHEVARCLTACADPAVTDIVTVLAGVPGISIEAGSEIPLIEGSDDDEEADEDESPPRLAADARLA